MEHTQRFIWCRQPWKRCNLDLRTQMWNCFAVVVYVAKTENVKILPEDILSYIVVMIFV